MKTTEIYIRPEIEVLDIMTEGVIATSGDQDFIFGDHDGGDAGAKRRDFWD